MFPNIAIKHTVTCFHSALLVLVRTNADGIVHLKTDSAFLHGYTLGLINDPTYRLIYAHHDIYNNPDAPHIATAVQTFYEKMFLKQNKPITYLQFQFI